MKFRKTSKEFFTVVNDAMENATPETNNAATAVGVGLIVYVVGSLTYFAVKGAKHLLK